METVWRRSTQLNPIDFAMVFDLEIQPSESRSVLKQMASENDRWAESGEYLDGLEIVSVMMRGPMGLQEARIR